LDLGSYLSRKTDTFFRSRDMNSNHPNTSKNPLKQSAIYSASSKVNARSLMKSRN
jgi:hypothetical protein